MEMVTTKEEELMMAELKELGYLEIYEEHKKNYDKSYDNARVEMKNRFEGIFGNLKQSSLNDLYATHKAIKNKKFGYVYFLENKDTGLTKIGYTSELDKRMKSIKQTFRNYIGIDPKLELTLLLFTHESLLVKVEKDYHRHYAENRKYGEWFDLKDTTYFGEAFHEDIKQIEYTFIDLDDTQNFIHYDKIELNLDFSNDDVDSYYGIDKTQNLNAFEVLFRGFQTRTNNKLLEIYNTSNEHSTSICTTETEISGDEFHTYLRGIKDSNSEKVVTMNSLKEEMFDESVVQRAIDSLK